MLGVQRELRRTQAEVFGSRNGLRIVIEDLVRRMVDAGVPLPPLASLPPNCLPRRDPSAPSNKRLGKQRSIDVVDKQTHVRKHAEQGSTSAVQLPSGDPPGQAAAHCALTPDILGGPCDRIALQKARDVLLRIAQQQEDCASLPGHDATLQWPIGTSRTHECASRIHDCALM